MKSAILAGYACLDKEQTGSGGYYFQKVNYPYIKKLLKTGILKVIKEHMSNLYHQNFCIKYLKNRRRYETFFINANIYGHEY